MLEEAKFREEIDRIWKDVHDRIGPIREDAYRILGYDQRHPRRHRIRSPRRTYPTQENVDPVPSEAIPEDPSIPDSDTIQTLAGSALAIVKTARGLQIATEKIAIATPIDVLRITSRAGWLLARTEELLSRFDRLKGTAGGVPFQVLSATMTVVATARDQLLAADGHVKNMKQEIGGEERNLLLLAVLMPASIIYIVAHPLFPVEFPFSVPDGFRPYWEVLFWSLFGAISLSLISISEDMMKDHFDPRNVNKYQYRIPVAPFTTAVLILFLGIVGFTLSSGDAASSGSILVDFASPNYSILIFLSFLFGFFAKRTLDGLDDAWRRIFPEGSEEKAEKKKSEGSAR